MPRKIYSAKGWNKGEPFDRKWPITEPRVMADAMNLLINSGVRTRADLLNVEFTMAPGDIENLTSVPPGWFSERRGDVVHLKPDFDKSAVPPEGSGIVLAFGRK
jgi:hypothetical protein